jgi:hypothetical protein
MDINVSIDAKDNADGSKTYIVVAQDYDGKRRFSAISAHVDADGKAATVKARGGVIRGTGLVHPDAWSDVKTVTDTIDEPLPLGVMSEITRGLAFVLDVECDCFTFPRLFGYEPSDIFAGETHE